MSVNLALSQRLFEQPWGDSLRELRQGYQTVAECLDEALAECEQREAELTDCRQQLAEARRAVSELEAQVTERARAEAELLGTCATLKKNLEAAQTELAESRQGMIALQSEVMRGQCQIEVQTQQIAQLQTQVTEVENHRVQQQQAAIADRAQWSERLRQLQQAIERQSESLAQRAHEALMAASDAETSDALRDAHNEINSARQRLEAQIEQNGLLRAQIESLQAERATDRQELETLRAQLQPLLESTAQLAQLRGELAAAQQELTRLHGEQRPELDEQKLTATIEHSAQQLAELRQALERQAELLAQRPQGVESEPLEFKQLTQENEQLQTRLASLQEERESLRQELSGLRGQIGPLTESLAEAAELRGKLVAADAELARLRDALTARPDEADLADQLASAVSERDELERELDLLRCRGAELAQSLAEQKRLATVEREHWSEELRQLRRAVERQAELLAHRTLQALSPSAGDTESPRSNGGRPNGDSGIIDSVLEQFEMLQRSKARRSASAP